MGIISCFTWGALRLIRVPFRSPEVAKASEASSTVHSPTDLHIAPHTSAGEQHSARLWSSRNVGTLKPSKHCYRKKYEKIQLCFDDLADADQNGRTNFGGFGCGLGRQRLRLSTRFQKEAFQWLLFLQSVSKQFPQLRKVL